MQISDNLNQFSSIFFGSVFSCFIEQCFFLQYICIPTIMNNTKCINCIVKHLNFTLIERILLYPLRRRIIATFLLTLSPSFCSSSSFNQCALHITLRTKLLNRNFAKRFFLSLSSCLSQENNIKPKFSATNISFYPYFFWSHGF